MDSKVKWFDLSSFGARLRVIPNSPMRGTTLTCLEIFDDARFQQVFKAGVGAETITNATEQFEARKGALGFGDFQSIRNGEDKRIIRLYSTKSQFTLRELKTLMPGLDASHLVDVPREEILMELTPAPELTEAWAKFAETALKYEGQNVWVPIESGFDKPYHESGTISEFVSSSGAYVHAVYGRTNLSPFNNLIAKLHQNNYRQNALVSYYVDREKALLDGWLPRDLKQVNLQFALPFHMTDKECVTAVRDVRFVPELMDIPPEYYFRGNVEGDKPGVIREFLEEMARMRGELSLSLASLKEMSEAGQLDDKAFYDELNKVFLLALDFATKDQKWHYGFVSKLPQVGDSESPYGYVLAPIHEMDELSMPRIGKVFKDFVPMNEAATNELNDMLAISFKRARASQMIRADEVAHAKLTEAKLKVAKKIDSTAKSDVTDKVKHVDVGEKIGGARKDYAKRSMVIADIEAMNDLERQAFVTKQNVWPPIDYAKLRENGIPPEVALALKVLKDQLSTAPDLSEYSARFVRQKAITTESGMIAACRDYVEAITLARDSLSEVKTMKELGEAVQALCVRGCTDESGEETNYISGGTVLQVQWGKEFSQMIYESKGYGRIPRKISSAISNKMDWPRNKTEDAKWEVLVKPTKVKSEAQLADQKYKADLDKELHSPHLEHVKRDGTDWRGGRDITGEDLLEHFSFRAAEYGHWLDQKERQEVLNMAFDSFCDLAEVLKLPPKELSLGGELAIAFGARGKGGRSAALAHFEPARFVINLTRMNGAGSLAHEWFHALDLKLGMKEGYSSEKAHSVKSPMGMLIDRMTTRPAGEEELHGEMVKGLQKSHRNVLSWFDAELQEKIARALTESVEKIRSQFMESATKTLRNLGADKFMGGGFVPREVCSGAFNELLLDLKLACDKPRQFNSVKTKVEGNVSWLVERLAVMVTIDAARDSKISLPEAFFRGRNERRSQFRSNAESLDKLRSAPYWVTGRELFARAGEAYVFDKITSNGARSDYLVYGVEEDRYGSEKYPGNPYPTGAERVKIAEAFDKVFDEYRLQCLQKMEVEPDTSLVMA